VLFEQGLQVLSCAIY